MIQQLNPPLPVVTPKGNAMAHLVIDYGPEFNLVWVCFQESGECWSWQNKEIRAQKNITFGRVAQGRNAPERSFCPSAATPACSAEPQ